MLCERCGANEAEVHLMKIVNGKRTVDYICKQCAREVIPFEDAAKMMKMTFSLEGILDLQEALKDLIFPATNGGAEAELTCHHCGETISWSMFAPSEEKSGEKVPCPEAACKPPATRDDLSLLKDKMADAVKVENYELAARIRDQIRDLKDEADKEKDA